MSCQCKPEYYTITSIDQYDGSPTVIGIFDSMRAVCFRLQRCYTSCGDEYRVECFHLSDAESEAAELTEQQVNRARYQKEERDKEAAVKELEEIKANQKEYLENIENSIEEHLEEDAA
tara:strand:- start:335 stop:688 length:354 start_codon:yes stop_codon:yes gene_type:complete